MPGMADEGEVVCRAGRRRTGWVSVGLGAAGVVAASVGLAYRGPGVWQGVCLVLGLAGMLSLGVLVARVRADAYGLRVRTWLRRRSVPWSEVADIRVQVQRARGGDVRRVRLILRDGRALLLPTPSAWGADPDFDARLDALRTLHRRYGAPASDHLHVVSHRTAGRSVLVPATLLALFLAGAGLAFWSVPGTASYAQAWRSADFCAPETPAAELDDCRYLVPAVIARAEAHQPRKKSWLYFAGGAPLVKKVSVSEGAARAFEPGDEVTLTLWRGEVMRVGNNHYVWNEHVPAAADAALIAGGLLVLAGFPAAVVVLRVRGRGLPDDDVLPSVLPFGVVLVVTGCWLLPLCHRYPTAPPASTGGLTWAATGSLVTLALFAWAWHATRIRRPGKDAVSPFSSAAVAREDAEVFVPARFLDATDYNPFGNFGTHVVLGGGEPPAVVPHGGPGRFAAKLIPVQRLAVREVRRPRGGDGEDVPQNWHIAELDDAGAPVRLAAAPADLTRILRECSATSPSSPRPRTHDGTRV